MDWSAWSQNGGNLTEKQRQEATLAGAGFAASPPEPAAPPAAPLVDEYSNATGHWDWFVEPETLRPYLCPEYLGSGCGHDSRVLMVGCGTSRLSEDMYDANISALLDSNCYALLNSKPPASKRLTNRHGPGMRLASRTSPTWTPSSASSP